VKTQTSLSKVFLHELIYVEVIGRTVYFHLKGGITIESTSTMSQVEAVLSLHKLFIRPHRSYIVNLDHIKHLSKDGFTTTSDLLIPVSRNAFKEVEEAYLNHSFQMETN
jgi:DNA-binding LytR/AlgR family response regulator